MSKHTVTPLHFASCHACVERQKSKAGLHQSEQLHSWSHSCHAKVLCIHGAPLNFMGNVQHSTLHWCFHAKHSSDQMTIARQSKGHHKLENHKTASRGKCSAVLSKRATIILRLGLGHRAAGMAQYKPGSAIGSTGGRSWTRNQREMLRKLPTTPVDLSSL